MERPFRMRLIWSGVILLMEDVSAVRASGGGAVIGARAEIGGGGPYGYAVPGGGAGGNIPGVVEARGPPTP